MRRTLIVSAIVVSVSQLSFARSVCLNESLSGYIAMGASGCTIRADIFSDFTPLNPITSAKPTVPGLVSHLLTPVGFIFAPGVIRQRHFQRMFS